MKYHARPGETPLDDLDGLKLKIPNITRRQLDNAEAENIQKAVMKYWSAKNVREFDLSFFRKLHREMFGNVWCWAGEFRTLQTNIGSLPERIQYDLIILVKDLSAWSKDIESCARFHHRAVQIHPFRNGNGRWARLLSGLWLQKHTGLKIRWPEGLGDESPIRQDYLDALRKADGMDYGPFIKLHSDHKDS